jgi:L-aspartate oxidase
VLARHVVLATGGVGQLYAVTTNPPEATGDGIAMALRAGVPVADVEFVQFHPTALHHPAMPRPLLSEALRGHGALLRDGRGDRFVDELAPRDVVSRAMAARMAEEEVDHLWLDATGLDRFAQRFPTIAKSLLPLGLDPAVDWLPIAPAAHHLSGGVVTDLWGATAVPGLWAVGEVACTGVHGANRLASNSLLEGMVFGARMADALGGGADGPTRTGVLGALLAADDAAARGATADHPAEDDAAAHGIGIRRRVLADLRAAPARPDTPCAPDVPKLRTVLQRAMTAGAGVVRSASSLAGARATVAEVVAAVGGEARGGPAGELVNLTTVAAALLDAAELREESRGAHTRAEHSGPHERWRCRLVHVAPRGGR